MIEEERRASREVISCEVTPALPMMRRKSLDHWGEVVGALKALMFSSSGLLASDAGIVVLVGLRVGPVKGCEA